MLGIEPRDSHMLRENSITKLHFDPHYMFLGEGVRDLEMELRALHMLGNPSIAEPPSTSCLQLYEDVYFVWVGSPKIISLFYLTHQPVQD